MFLQQASDATRGIYMQLSNPESLLQYLMVCALILPQIANLTTLTMNRCALFQTTPPAATSCPRLKSMSTFGPHAFVTNA